MEDPSACVRVLIADDSTLVRERLASLLWEIPRVEVVAETSDVPGTVDGLLTLLPDIILLDISMPGGSGFDVLDRIRIERLATRVVVFTTHVDSEFENRARECGAAAFFNKSKDFIAAAEFVRNFVLEERK